MSTPALDALAAAGLRHQVVEHGPVRSLDEAAAALGVAVPDVVKTLVVRRGDDDYLFVLVPGDRVISWPRLRALLGVNRLSLPHADTARAVTGYERGAITPFGAAAPSAGGAPAPVRGPPITLGTGRHGTAVLVEADAAVAALAATLADITDPAA